MVPILGVSVFGLSGRGDMTAPEAAAAREVAGPAVGPEVAGAAVLLVVS
jgi:hypothetical protein